MKTPRKGTSDAGADSSKVEAGDKPKAPTTIRKKLGSRQWATQNSEILDLPPNENIRRHPDEVYGDRDSRTQRGFLGYVFATGLGSARESLGAGTTLRALVRAFA